MFDPWTATFEQAIAEQEEFSMSGGNIFGALAPADQVAAARHVLSLKEYIDGGDGFAVLEAIRHCVTHGLVAPEWLAYAFNRRYDSVLNCRVGSWDDPSAFGRPYPKGTHLAARRKARKGMVTVWSAVKQQLHLFPETPIDKSLFEKIGKPLGFGATLTEEYYYRQERTNLAAHREFRETLGAVRSAVKQQLHLFPETPIDKSLFEKIGKQLGLSAMEMEEYYYIGEIAPIDDTANI